MTEKMKSLDADDIILALAFATGVLQIFIIAGKTLTDYIPGSAIANMTVVLWIMIWYVERLRRTR